MSRDTTALVIAGGSFIGRHLCRRLRDGGIAVRATGCGEELGYWDIGDPQRIRELLQRVEPDWVFQCAAATTPDASPEELSRVHVNGTLNVLRASAEIAPSAILVFLGSAAEYGAIDGNALPVNENHPMKPASLFGATKAAQTHLAFAAAAEWRLRVAVARPFNVLGPGLPEHYLAAALAKRLLSGGETSEPLGVLNAEATRDFVDVRDVAEALVGIVQRSAPAAGEPVLFNIASGVETPVVAIARELCALHGHRPAVAVGATESRSKICRSCGDASRLRRATGWRPRVGWRESLHDLWEWERRAVAA
jgi:GDP-4-dehydro-6-deoxy-D-mannose reductase